MIDSINLTVHAQFQDDPYKFEGENYFRNIKMISEKGENAEAYFSFDDKKLIYQSSYGDMDCDQIFTMNIDGSEKTLVSTGKGRTTCAYFYPSNDKILYASTHHYADDCLVPPDRSKGYVWKLYDEFDIFTADADGSNKISSFRFKQIQ